jgi:hypothetical protein
MNVVITSSSLVLLLKEYGSKFSSDQDKQRDGGDWNLNQVVSFNLGRIFLFFIFGFKLLWHVWKTRNNTIHKAGDFSGDFIFVFSFICLGKLCHHFVATHTWHRGLTIWKERVVSPSHSKDHDRWKTRTEQFSILFLFFYDSHQDLREREKMIEKTKYSSQVNRLRTPGHISAPGVPNNLQHQEFHNI